MTGNNYFSEAEQIADLIKAGGNDNKFIKSEQLNFE